MPNDYSVEIHRYFSQLIEQAEDALKAESPDAPRLRGRIEELLRLREFLQKNIDLKDYTYF